MEIKNLNETYILNPAYKFRSDITSIVITNEDSLYFNSFEKHDQEASSFAWKTHPLITYLFSFFNGSRNYKSTISLLSKEIGFPEDEIQKSINPFIENTETLIFPMLRNEVAYVLPKYFLIKKEVDTPVRDLLSGINIQNIIDNFDVSSARFNIPNQISLMLNNVCVTNCIYCYANKSHKIDEYLPFERVKEIIKEARKLGVRDIEINGGEFFLYKDWYELLGLLNANRYGPYISTKIPINEETILKLKEVGIEKIQISFDSVDNNQIMKILNVESTYLEKMKITLLNLEKHGIKVKIKSVITNLNDEIDDIRALLAYLSNFKNLLQISIAPADYSLYNHFTYASSRKKLELIKDYIEEIQFDFPFILDMQGIAITPFELPIEDRKASFEKRAQCSGNLTGFFILPDGKVTICEQMYWHPFFILGDLNNNSLMDVWNSEKALKLWNIKQSDLNPESACYKCEDFEICRRGKGSCWRFAISAYGFDNYDFPDYNCPYAPPVFNNIFHI